MICFSLFFFSFFSDGKIKEKKKQKEKEKRKFKQLCPIPFPVREKYP